MEREVTAQSLPLKNIQPGQTCSHQIKVFADEILSEVRWWWGVFVLAGLV